MPLWTLIALLGVAYAPASLAVGQSLAIEQSVAVSPSDSAAQSPDVAIGPDGSINVVWLGENTAAPNAAQIAARGHSHDSKTNLYFARSVDGGKNYSTPLRINKSDGDVWGFAISKPRIAAGPDGRIHIVFPGNTLNPATGNTETIALYTRSDASASKFEEPRRLNVDSITDTIAKDDGGAFATLAVDASNTVYAAWVDTRTMSDGDMGRLAITVSRNGGKTFEPDKIILPDIVCPCCQLTSAIDAEQRLLLGIRLVEGGYRDSEIIALNVKDQRPEWRRRVANARWEINGCPRKPTAIAVSGKNLFAAYYSGAETPDGAYVTHSSDSGASWSKPIALHAGATRSDAPTLAFAGDTVHAVWQARAGESGFRLFTSRASKSSPQFSLPEALPIPEGGSARLPAIAAHNDGSLQIVWQHDSRIRSLRWNRALKFDVSRYSQTITGCDRLASHPDDPFKVSAGVERSNIDLPTAIEACELAVARDPGNPRLRYQLGRVYGYSGQGEKGVVHREAAVAGDYPQALFVIGYLHLDGLNKAVKDPCRAAQLIHRSALFGRLAGLVGYPMWVMEGRFTGCPTPQDPVEMRLFLEEAAASTGDFYVNSLVTELRRKLGEPSR
ncbi:MAG: hypothetical protein ACKOCF_01230 [Gammaproteobacteria bacterium]